WSPDGKTVATEVSAKVRLWDAETGKLRHELSAPRGGTTTLHWSRDSKTLLSGRGDGTIVCWDAATGRHTATLLGLRNGQGLALSPDGHFRGAQGIERELVYVIQTEKGQETLTPEAFGKRFGWKNDPDRVRVLAP